MPEFKPCRHDGESMVSLMEEHGYSEDDMLLCKLCQKHEIETLLAENKLLREYLERNLPECLLNNEPDYIDRCILDSVSTQQEHHSVSGDCWCNPRKIGDGAWQHFYRSGDPVATQQNKAPVLSETETQMDGPQEQINEDKTPLRADRVASADTRQYPGEYACGPYHDWQGPDGGTKECTKCGLKMG